MEAYGKINLMTIEEIIDKYGELLTAEQIEILKNSKPTKHLSLIDKMAEHNLRKNLFTYKFEMQLIEKTNLKNNE